MSFLVFLGVTLLGLAIVAYLLGPNILRFVFHTERRTEPVVLINLLDFAGPKQQATYRRTFERPATLLIEALGGRTIWIARAEQVVRGDVLDGWPVLELVDYPSRSAFIELVTSSDYRALGGAREKMVKRSALLSATPVAGYDAMFSPLGTHAQAVRLMAGAHDDSIDRYDTQWSSQDATMLARHDGKLIWRASLNPLVADAEQRFDAILVYGFTNAAQRAAWAHDTERETLQTLQRRLFRRDVLVLADTVVSDTPGSSAQDQQAGPIASPSLSAPSDALPATAP